MAEHQPQTATPDRIDLPPAARSFARLLLVVGAALILGSLGVALAAAEHGLSRFYHAYLLSFGFALSLALGALLFVMVQHLVRAGWSVTVRRLAESYAGTLPVLALLALPFVVSALSYSGSLYPWAVPIPPELKAAKHADAAFAGESFVADAPVDPAHAPGDPAHGALGDGHAAEAHPTEGLDPLTLSKTAWLNPPFFALRVVAYFAVFAMFGWWFWRQSVLQDLSGDLAHTLSMQKWSAPAIAVAFLALTLASFDLFMSLDSTWFSTIFGVYYFAGGARAFFATLILTCVIVQQLGYLRRSITTEHYHDLGKFLFGFTFFWGYIAFSQYMLIWYASLPEVVPWFVRRGATGVSADMNGWTWVSLALLFGHFLIPFAGLLSKHVKRNRFALAFWAGWTLVFHWVDQWWIVMPELGDGAVRFGLVELAALAGVLALVVGSMLRLAARHPLRPARDPRLRDALAFQNI